MQEEKGEAAALLSLSLRRRNEGGGDRALGSPWRCACVSGGVREREGERIERWGSIGLGLELVGAAGPWEAGPVEKEVARGLAGQLGWALSLSLISIRKEIERGKEREG